MYKTYELLPEYDYLITEKFSPFEIDGNYVARHIVFDSTTPLRIPKSAIGEPFYGNTVVYGHEKQDKHGNTFFKINATSRKTGENFSFDTKSADFERKKYGYVPLELTPAQIAAQNARIAESQRKKENSDRWSARELEKARQAFAVANDDVASHGYWLEKFNDCGTGENYAIDAAKLAQGVRRGAFRYQRKGVDVVLDTLMFEIKTDDTVIGYQHIYSALLPNKDTNKAFIGETKGGHFAIGEVIEGKPSWTAEGLASGLTVALTTNLPVIVCLSAGNMMTVAAQFKQSRLNIAADDDQKENGNTGIFTALKIAGFHKNTRIFKPLVDVGTDYADLLKSEGLDAVKKQLSIRKSKENKALYEITPATKCQIAYAKQLLQYVHKGQERAVIEQLCEAIAAIVNRKFSLKSGIQLAKDAIAQREFLFDVEKAITDIVEKKTARVSRRNCITNGKTTKIDVAGLTIEQVVKKIFDTGCKVVINAQPMGTGKTVLAGAIIKTLGKDGCVFVAPRTSIVSDNSRKFSLDNYEKITPRFNPKNLAVCYPSAQKFQTATRFKYHFHDEKRQSVEGGLSSNEMSNRLGAVSEDKKSIQNAEFYYAADADFNDDTVDYIAANTPHKIYELVDSSLPKLNGKTIHVLPEDLENALFHALEQGRAGKKLFIALDFAKEKAEGIYAHFDAVAATGGAKLRVLLITADNKGDAAQKAFLENADVEILNWDIVIASPVVQSGFSIQTPHIDTVYGLFSTGTVAPNEALQAVARCRTVTDIYMAFAPQKHSERLTDANLLIEGEQLSRAHWEDAARDMLSEFDMLKRVEILDGGMFKFSEFDALRLKEKAKKNADMADFACNVLTLAEIKGFSVAFENDETIAAPEFNEAEQADIDAAKNRRVNAIANLPEEQRLANKSDADNLKIQNNRTSEQSIALDRWHVQTVLGKKDGITEENVKDVDNGLGFIVANRLDITTPRITLAKRDYENKYQTRDSSTSSHQKAEWNSSTLAKLILLSDTTKENKKNDLLKKLRKAHSVYDDVIKSAPTRDKNTHKIALHNTVKKLLNPLEITQKASKRGISELDYLNSLEQGVENLTLDSTSAEIICYWLSLNAPELAVNGFSNHVAVSKYPIKTVTNLLKKIGFDVQSEKREGIAEGRTRIYKICTTANVVEPLENHKKIKIGENT
jgi:hypothetical protein